MNEQIKFYQQKLQFEMDPSDLFEQLDTRNDLIVLDCRQAFGFEREHIPTAINLPHKEMTEDGIKDLDRTKTYVCYCDGIGCNASTKGALNMAKLGFKVVELIGGIEWWKFDGYATEGANATSGSVMKCAC